MHQVSEQQMQARVGTSVGAGKYRITELLGAGAMGAVFKARHIELDRDVAVKVLHSWVTSMPDAAARFRREAKAASRLHHRNSIQILDVGEDDGECFIVMEYLEGRQLFDVIADAGRLTPNRAIGLMSQILGALAAAHEVGVVHRDIKPENVVVTDALDDDGQPIERLKVLDFGIAKLLTREAGTREQALTKDGQVAGTPAYMAPEQATGVGTDERSDIYSCGVLLFLMLTGELPFDSETDMGLMLQHISAPVPNPRERNPRLSERLSGLLMASMAKDPAGRPQTAREFRRLLKASVGAKAATTDQHGAAVVVAHLGENVGFLAPRDTAAGGVVPVAAVGRVVTLPTSERPRRYLGALLALLGLISAALAYVLLSGDGNDGSDRPMSVKGGKGATENPGVASETAPPSDGVQADDRQLAAAGPDPALGRAELRKDSTGSGAFTAANFPDAGSTAGGLDAGIPTDTDADSAADAGVEEADSTLSKDSADDAQSDGLAGSDGSQDDTAAPAAVVFGARVPRPTPRKERKRRPSKAERAKVATGKVRPPPVRKVVVAPPPTTPVPTKIIPPSIKTSVPVPTVPATTSPKKPEVPAPKPPIPAPKMMSATVTVAGLSSSGSLSSGTVKRAVRSRTSRYAKCFSAAATQSGGGRKSTIKVALTIDEDGFARRVKLTGAGFGSLKSCLKGALNGVRSHKRPDTGVVRATFSLRFQ